MDDKQLIFKLNKLSPGGVLEVGSFGRSRVLLLWVSAQSILNIGLELKMNKEWSFDWLENMSVVELEEVIVVTYFLRSTSLGHVLMLRVSSVPGAFDQWVEFPSVREVWPMVAPFEQEVIALFGIRFIPSEVTQFDYGGFPLRKSYQLPREGV